MRRCGQSAPSHPKGRVAALALLLLAAAPSTLAAQDGAPLAGERFDIDLVTGPVIGPNRVVGMGGAYVALPRGVEAASWNPAAYAARGAWETEWFEWDLTGSLVPSTIASSDFDNDGDSGFTYDSFLFGSLGGGAMFGEVGFGLLANIQTYAIGPDANLALAVLNYGGAYAPFGSQLVIGAGIRTALLSITRGVTGASLVDFDGSAPEVGAVLQLDGQPFRVGIAARMPVQSESDTLVAAGFTLPEAIRLPWELQAGFALQLGPRPLNRIFVNPHDVEERLRAEMLGRRRSRMAHQLERELLAERLLLVQQQAPPSRQTFMTGSADEPRDAEFWKREAQERYHEERELAREIERQERARLHAAEGLPRRHLLLSTEVILVGPTENGVGLESFLSQTRHASGAHPTLGIRAGVEGEPIEHWVKMRAGAYLEPSRFAGVPYRMHGTVGFDVRLFTWDLFALVDPFTTRFVAAADVAERYVYASIGLGIWH